MRIRFETDDNLIKEVDIPFAASDIEFGDFCDFRSAEYLWFNVGDAEPIENFILLRNAVACLVKCDIDSLPLFSSEEETDLITMGYKIQIGDTITLIKVYAHLVTLINRYKPEEIPQNFAFTHKQKDFVINTDSVIRVMSQARLTLGESLEVLEYQRRAAARNETDPKGAGNIDFNLGLTEFAILIRQPGEKLPSDKSDRRKFIDRRKELFSTLPLDLVLDIRFFLTNSLIIYNQNLRTNSFGKVRQAVTGSKKVITKRNRQKKRRQPGR